MPLLLSWLQQRQGLDRFAGNLGSPSQLPALNEPKGIQPLPSRRQPLMKGLSPHFPASGGVGTLTHFSISLMCSSHDIWPELPSFIVTTPLLCVSSTPCQPSAALAGYIGRSCTQGSPDRKWNSVFYSQIHAHSPEQCVFVCEYVCMSTEAARKKEIRTHFMPHVNPRR